jgi:hypothetical protein
MPIMLRKRGSSRGGMFSYNVDARVARSGRSRSATR